MWGNTSCVQHKQDSQRCLNCELTCELLNDSLVKAVMWCLYSWCLWKAVFVEPLKWHKNHFQQASKKGSPKGTLNAVRLEELPPPEDPATVDRCLGRIWLGDDDPLDKKIRCLMLDDLKDLDLKCRDFFLPPLLGIIVAQYRNSCSPSSTTVQPDKIEVFLVASCAGSCKELLVSCLAIPNIPMIMFYCNFTYQQLSAIYHIYLIYLCTGLWMFNGKIKWFNNPW